MMENTITAKIGSQSQSLNGIKKVVLLMRIVLVVSPITINGQDKMVICAQNAQREICKFMETTKRFV